MQTKTEIERVVFLECDQDAEELIHKLESDQEDEVMHYLTNFHFPGTHETASEHWASPEDTVHHCSGEWEGYVVTYNYDNDTIGLEWVVR